MIASKLFDIRTPFRTKYEVKKGLFNMENEKKVLEILTVKKLLKASDNADYAQFLNDYDYALIQGNIAHFFAWQNMRVSKIANFYAKYLVLLPIFFRIIFFLLLFFLKLLQNYTLLVLTLLIKYSYSNHTKTETVVARNLMFEIIKQAQERGWSINNINTDLLSDNVTSSFIKHMYPDLDFRIWDRKVTAIQNYYGIKSEHKFASFYTKYPMFWEVRKFLIQNPSDILLIATRQGGSEHEFLQLLKYDNEVSFKFACVYDVDDINGKIRGGFVTQLQTFLAYIFKSTLNQFYISLEENGRTVKKIKLISKNQKKLFFLPDSGQKSDLKLAKFLKKEGLENIKIEKISKTCKKNINFNLRAFFQVGFAGSKIVEEVWEIAEK